MKRSTKRLPAKERNLVLTPGAKFGARQALRESYRRASRAIREALVKELGELDHLSSEGLDD